MAEVHIKEPHNSAAGEPSDHTSNREKGHTSIIYFHGIGSPRQHVSLTSFLDGFDLQGQREDFNELGRPRSFKYKSEVLEDGSTQDFIQFTRIKKFQKKHTVVKYVRAYEGYWGDDHFKHMGLIAFFSWLFSILLNSILALISPWRKYPALRIRYLGLISDEFKGPLNQEKLERLYKDFENWENRKLYSSGSFSEFKKFLSHKTVLKQYGDFRVLAESWRRRYLYDVAIRNLKNFLFVVVLFGFLLLLLFICFEISEVLLSFIHVTRFEQLSAFMFAAATFYILINIVWVVIRRRISDIAAWTLDSESDENYAVRQRRVDGAMKLIRQVISDPMCTDCIIVGHSLGSAVAVEALLREARRCEAVNISAEEKVSAIENIRKIRFVFTVGSPIENIFSRFQSDGTFSHRYSRLTEQRSLSLSSHPFTVEGYDGGAVLVNFWSRFDPISAEILSLRRALNQRSEPIFNIESFPKGAPSLTKAHSGYFFDPSVISPIYRAVMTGKLDGRHLRRGKMEWDIGWPLILAGILGSAIALLGFLVFFSRGGSMLTWLSLTFGPAVIYICVLIIMKSFRSRYLPDGHLGS
jgi:pimeloyl-ACP methyl ester carboxylesterase